MDISNLKARQCILTDFLKTNNYSKDVIGNIRSCIRIALEYGCDPQIKSYEELFSRITQDRGIEKDSPRYCRLKHGIGTIWAFDLFGKLPDNSNTGFLCARKTADCLNPYYRELADSHLINGNVNGKTEKTIYVERNAITCLYAHLQKEGAPTLEDVTPAMVFSFFHDGEKQLRGSDYKCLVRTALKAAGEEYRASASKIISWLPKIKRSYRLFDFLSKDEGDKIRLCLENEENTLSVFDRTIGWILYFYGLRCTDIANLQLSSIDWDKDRISLVQSKTGYPLTLPINGAVGNNLFDYITTRIPKVSGKGPVFVPARRKRSVMDKIKYSVLKIFKVAGVRINEGEKGVRVFRHHFVTHLLSKGVLCEVVSKLAGHHSPESVKFYADADYQNLKECAVDISMYPVDDKIFQSV